MSRPLPRIYAVVTLAGFLCVAGSAVASVVTQMDLETLVRLSAVIVHGEVESVVSRVEGSTINTYVTIRVAEGLKGAQGLARVTLKHLGGRVGDLAVVVPGVPRFQTGERVVVFAQPLKTGELTVTGLFQGKYRIEVVGGVEFAVQEAAGSGAHAVGGSRAPAPGSQPLSDLLDRVRQLVTRYPSSGSSWTPAIAGDEPPGSFFTLLGSPNPGRWFEPDSGGSIPFLFNPSGAPGVVPGGARAAFVAGLAAWGQTSIPGTSVKLVDGGNTTAQCFAPFDGTNAVSHNDPCDEMPAFDSGSCSGVLAFGGFGSTSAGTKTINGVTFWKIVGGDVVFNAGADCFWSGAGNYAETGGHEIGHAIGLGHSCGDSSSPPCSSNPLLDDALMRALAHGDGRGASPRTDDINAIHLVYEFFQAAVNQPTFSTGQTLALTVSGNLTAVSDAYLAVILPDGTFFTFGPGLSPSPLGTIVPLATGLPALGLFSNLPLLSYTFGGLEAAGGYAWVVAFAPAGVSPLSARIALHVVGFTFAP